MTRNMNLPKRPQADIDTAPYDTGVYMLTGINGIGKSTIVEAISDDHPEVIPMHASHELRTLFNGVSREELEKLDPEEKLARMVLHFTGVFDRALNDERPVVLDTHLLVPIRKREELVYENIWSDDYAPYINSMVMLAADPPHVHDWRIADELATGRKRDTNLDHIEADQAANIAALEDLKEKGVLPKATGIVHNTEGHIDSTRLAVESIFRSR